MSFFFLQVNININVDICHVSIVGLFLVHRLITSTTMHRLLRRNMTKFCKYLLEGAVLPGSKRMRANNKTIKDGKQIIQHLFFRSRRIPRLASYRININPYF